MTRRPETFLSQDLAVERALFGRARVARAPMRDTGWRQLPRRWSDAARFVSRVLDEDATAGVVIHCMAGSLDRWSIGRVTSAPPAGVADATRASPG